MKNIPYIIVIILLLFFIPERIEEFNQNFNLSISVLYVLLLIYFLYQQKKQESNWLRFDVLFLIGYTIVHFQIPFLASINIEPQNPQFIWINKKVVNYASWMSLVAIALWMLGFSIVKAKRTINYNRLFVINNKLYYLCDNSVASGSATKVKKNDLFFKVYDGIILLSFLVFIGLVGTPFLKGAYAGTSNWGEGAAYVFLLLRNLIFLRIIYFFSELPRHSTIPKIFSSILSNKIFISILIAYTLLFLFVGDRGPVMQILLIIGGAYALYIKPISFKYLMLFVIIGAFGFTIISFGRGSDLSELGEKNIFQRGYANFSENKDETYITDDLATSVRIQYRALDVVPDKHPYLYGLTFFTVGVGTIPFLGSLTLQVFNIPRYYKSSSEFFTFLGQGHFASFGEGSEILADIYINFGIYGVFILMFFFGVVTSRISKRATNFEFTYVIIMLVLLTASIYINRAMLLTPLKDIVYVLVINFLITRLIK